MEEKNSVLIVDDEKSNLLYLNHILCDEHTIYTARTADEALERAREYKPDLILLDIVMPGMDGYAVIDELKNSEATSRIPVIFITGLSDQADEEKGLSLGAVDYISKPFNPSIVRLRVMNQLKILNQTRLIIEKETAERSSHAKSEFLSRISHEMRTPMNAIIGMTHIARKTDDLAKIKSCLTKADAASRNLLQMIDDVLDISDIDEGRLTLSPSEFHFESFMERLKDEMEPHFSEKRQTFTSRFDPSIPDILICDELRLTQVLRNLLSNASKFTGDLGTIELKASVSDVEHDILALRFDVSDSGIGISPEQQKKLFVEFEQVDGGISRKYGGAGLGLYISKTIAEMMGGEIRVESEPGCGSVFTLLVKAQIKTHEDRTHPSSSFQGKTALLVEDVMVNREIVMSMLEDTRLHIQCAENGREAVELYTSNPESYDVVFMDINMPEMDGVEATRRIRGMGSGSGSQVPIIAMTANTLPEEVASYLEAGMTDHIGKPVDFDKLLRMIRRYIQ